MAHMIKFVGLDKLESALLTKAQLGAVKTVVKKERRKASAGSTENRTG